MLSSRAVAIAPAQHARRPRARLSTEGLSSHQLLEGSREGCGRTAAGEAARRKPLQRRLAIHRLEVSPPPERPDFAAPAPPLAPEAAAPRGATAPQRRWWR